MDDQLVQDYTESNEITVVVREITRLFAPSCIYLYNRRFGASGGTSAFKLCVIAGFESKERAEREIYTKIDSEIPFDVLLYTQAEWRNLLDSPGTFARKIHENGVVVYGQK